MSAHAHSHPQDDIHNPDVTHETSDINVRAIIWFIVVLASTVVLVDIAMAGLFKVFDHIERANDPYVTPLAPSSANVTAPAQSFPEPRLQTTPWEDLKVLRADETNYLNSYGWVDQQGGEAHIPIDKAKALLLQRGIPARAGGSDPTEGTHYYSTGESSGGRDLPASAPMPSASGAKSATETKPGGGK